VTFRENTAVESVLMNKAHNMGHTIA